MLKKGVMYLLANVMWLVTIGLGLWFFLLSKNSFLGVLANLYVRGNSARSYEVRFFEKAYIVIIGLIFTIAMLAVFEFFRFGAEKPDFLDRISLVIGIELVLIFVADFTWLWAQHFQSKDYLRWSLLIGELIIGSGMLAYSIRTHRLRTG
jgi:hypothetical protein